jgi:nucleoside-diphosphate-sugar epimerase
MLPVIVEEQCFGRALALVVAGANSQWVDVPPIAFRLRVNRRIAIDFAGRGLKDASARALGQAEHVDGAMDAGFQRLNRIAETIIGITDSKSKTVFLPLPADDPRQRQPDVTIARTELGWEPKVTVEDGLKETVSYFRYLLSR